MGVDSKKPVKTWKKTEKNREKKKKPCYTEFSLIKVLHECPRVPLDVPLILIQNLAAVVDVIPLCG